MTLTSTKTTATEDLVKEVDVLARELDRLKGTYEQYFLGLERKEPVKLRETVANMVRKYSGLATQNTRIKFRFQQLIARYNTFSTYWDRVLKEIEEGRYQRDVFKYQIQTRTGTEKPGSKTTAPKKPVQEDPMVSLFNRYVEERKKCKEETKGLAFDKFKVQMENQVKMLKEKSGIENVKFSVVTENGKAKIKAVAQPTKSKT